jgi:hypothetical protein
MAGELHVQIELPLTEAGREFYACVDACMASAGLHPGEFCMEDSQKGEGNFTPINWDQRGQPNDQRGSVWSEFIGPSEYAWLWLWVFYANDNKVGRIWIRTFQDGEEWTTTLQNLCLSLHRTFNAVDTRGRLENHPEAWFHFGKGVWRPAMFPDLEAERVERRTMAGKMLSWSNNAPAHWPPVVAPLLSTKSGGWIYVHPEDARVFAKRMAETFARASCNCRIHDVETRWQGLEVPIQVQEGQKIVRVFPYAHSTVHTASHFAAVKEFLAERGEADPVYFAPEPLPPVEQQSSDEVNQDEGRRTSGRDR